ncbi:MAG: hypothetical protein LIP01_16060 [Tannerellaceae bacterium]|nr:hypothetical protein [Tannerellaceae bacterium]
MYRGSDVMQAANILAEILKSERFRWTSGFNMPRSSGAFLFDSRLGYCREECDITLYTMRACGIPTAFDFFIYSPEYQKGHTWNVIRDTTGDYLPLYFTSFFASRDGGMMEEKKGKYTGNVLPCNRKKSRGISNEKKTVPFFRNRHIQDVSGYYFKNENVTISLPGSKEKYLYLGVFSPQGWVPVEIAKIEKGKALYRNIEPGIIYQPLYSDGIHHRPATYPFLYMDKELHWFKPDEENLSSIHITRKMPFMENFRRFMEDEVNGSKFEASNDRSFRNVTLLYAIDTHLTHPHNLFSTLTDQPFRYFRYTAPPNQILQLSNVTFYTGKELKLPVPMEIIQEDPIEKLKQSICLDGNILTYYYSKHHSHLVFDAGAPVSISTLLFYPRNDDNFIAPDDMYELFYQNGEKGWISLGIQKSHSLLPGMGYPFKYTVMVTKPYQRKRRTGIF